MKKMKKGFTIVELVIVIGVIAILSAILIPTFVNLTDKANKSARKSDLANAYSMYAADAADGYIDGHENDKNYEVKLYAQNKVALVKGGESFVFTTEWGTEDADIDTTDANPLTPSDNGKYKALHADAVYGGYQVFYLVEGITA